MSIIEAIKKRESVRTYTGERLSEELISQIGQFIAQHKAPFGVNVRIELINTVAGEKPVKLGTYGFIGGASDYLVLIYEEAPMAEEGAAYLFEQVILFCTDLGLGTCWLGGSFSRGDFKKQIELRSNEVLRIVSPIGYKSDKKRFIESLIKPESRKKNPRKPFNALFFDKDFTTPLEEDKAGIYRQPLEMVRLGPSANNKQSWRVILDGNVLHFYKTPAYGFSAIDMGIALCHFEQTCIGLGIKGKFKVLDAPQDKSAQYSISWISQNE
ncbi:MAG: hypothetical protein LBV74_22405 [Tannerella sp.]|jgi:nitroreductase|nr:hypothetical protein [Tannerella sp.]